MGNTKLTLEKRIVIENLILQGLTDTEIAKRIGYNRRSVDKEIDRNSSNGRYSAELAQILADRRRTLPRKKSVTQNPDVISFVKTNIKLYAPDVLAGRAKLENSDCQVSTESIYKIVYSLGKSYTDFLPSKQPRRKTRNQRSLDARGALKNQISIHCRPQSIATNKYNGHLEGDTIVGKNHQGAIATLVDKKTRYGMGGLSVSRSSADVVKVINRCLEKSERKIHSVTFDNGKEFANHEAISETTGAKVYFADPGSPHQHGQNENFNRILRQYFPNGTNFTKLDSRTVQSAFRRINRTPRKILDYKTPVELFKRVKIRALLN